VSIKGSGPNKGGLKKEFSSREIQSKTGSMRSQERQKLRKVIEVAFSVDAVSDVSTVNNQFNADFTLVLQWLENDETIATIERLEEAADFDALSAFWNDPKVFMPSVEFGNAADCKQVEAQFKLRRFPRLDMENKNYVKLTQRYICTFRANFNLAAFPFDMQNLDIKLTVRQQGKTEVQLHTSKLRASKLDINNVAQNPEFSILPYAVHAKKGAQRKQNKRGGGKSVYILTIVAQRHWAHYIWSHAFTNFLMQCLGWCVSLGFAAEQQYERVEFLLTLVLTTVACKLALNNDLPKLPNLTALDQYLLFSYIFLFLLTAEATFVGVHARVDDKAPHCIIRFKDGVEAWARDFDWWFLTVLFCLWTVVQLIAFGNLFAGIMHIRRERQKNAQQKLANWQETQRRASLTIETPLLGVGSVATNATSQAVGLLRNTAGVAASGAMGSVQVTRRTIKSLAPIAQSLTPMMRTRTTMRPSAGPSGLGSEEAQPSSGSGEIGGGGGREIGGGGRARHNLSSTQPVTTQSQQVRSSNRISNTQQVQSNNTVVGETNLGNASGAGPPDVGADTLLVGADTLGADTLGGDALGGDALATVKAGSHGVDELPRRISSSNSLEPPPSDASASASCFLPSNELVRTS
jgi:hypothetical protein